MIKKKFIYGGKKYFFITFIFLVICFVLPGYLHAKYSEELEVADTHRISHPAYSMSNTGKGLRNPFNIDNSRVLLYESTGGQEPSHPLFPEQRNTGRGLIFGCLKSSCINETSGTAKADSIDSTLQDLNLGNLDNLSANKRAQSINDWDNNTINIPSKYRAQVTWSPYSGETNIIYALNNATKKLVVYNIDTGDETSIISYEFSNCRFTDYTTEESCTLDEDEGGPGHNWGGRWKCYDNDYQTSDSCLNAGGSWKEADVSGAGIVGFSKDAATNNQGHQHEIVVNLIYSDEHKGDTMRIFTDRQSNGSFVDPRFCLDGRGCVYFSPRTEWHKQSCNTAMSWYPIPHIMHGAVNKSGTYHYGSSGTGRNDGDGDKCIGDTNRADEWWDENLEMDTEIDLTHMDARSADDYYIAGNSTTYPWEKSRTRSKPFLGCNENACAENRIYQVLFDADYADTQPLYRRCNDCFKLNLLVAQRGAALWWKNEGEENEKIINYDAMPSPTISPNAEYIFYHGTNNKYTRVDYNEYPDVTLSNWEGRGSYLAELAYAATGDIYYVSSIIGSDAYSCEQAKSASTPRKTIAKGYDCLSDGSSDKLIIKSGIYDSIGAWGKDGAGIGSEMIIMAAVGETAIINDTIQMEVDGSYLIFDGIEWTGMKESALHWRTNSHDTIIRNNYFHDIMATSTGVVKPSYGAYNITIENNIFEENGWDFVKNRAATGPHDIYVSRDGTHDIVIRKNLFVNTHGNSIQFKNDVWNFDVYGNVFYFDGTTSNNRRVYYFSGDSKPINFYNNTIYLDCGNNPRTCYVGSSMHHNDESEITIKNNIVYTPNGVDNDYYRDKGGINFNYNFYNPTVSGSDNGNNSFSGEPLFNREPINNPVMSDFRVLSNSPVCGAGEGGQDIGAYSCEGVSQTCTSFTYNCGACQPDNTKACSVVSAYPIGCTGGNPELIQSCQYNSATPAIISPTEDSVLTEASQIFHWDNNQATVYEWNLFVGTTLGGKEIDSAYNRNPSVLSATVDGLPTDGSTIYVRLWYKTATDTDNNWSSIDYQYATRKSGYGISDFIKLVADWLKNIFSIADVNEDGVVNTRDLGIMMSNWNN